MNPLYILITVVPGSEAFVPMCIKGLRLFGKSENIHIVLVDNGAGLQPEAYDCPDVPLSYIDMEGAYPFGEMLRQIIPLLETDHDLLLLSPYMVCTPGSLTAFQTALSSYPSAVVLGGTSNGIRVGHQYVSDYTTYDEAIQKRSFETPSGKVHRMIAPLDGAICIRQELLETVGGFDCEAGSESGAVEDFCIRAAEHRFDVYCVKDAFFWALPGFQIRVGRGADWNYLEKKWGMHYFNTIPNPYLVNAISVPKDTPIHVLEIGCDCGATLLDIQDTYPNATVCGAELNPSAAAIANRYVTACEGNIEHYDLPYSEDTFDYIIFGDVLEHLRDPYETIRYCKKLLKHGGAIISSIPNLMHVSVMKELLNGTFTYQETGLLDRTHIHFFTQKEILRMFLICGYQTESLSSIQHPLSADEEDLIDWLLQRSGSDVTREMYQTFQYLCIARNP